jgi:hypothetical protein
MQVEGVSTQRHRGTERARKKEKPEKEKIRSSIFPVPLRPCGE